MVEVEIGEDAEVELVLGALVVLTGFTFCFTVANSHGFCLMRLCAACDCGNCFKTASATLN